MFDLGFSELLVIGVVALIVIGPERLPKVARTAGAWLGRLNRYVSDVKQDINREMQLEELRKVQQEMKDSVQKYEILGEETVQEVKQELSQADKLMQAMSTTDGGLAAREYEKAQAEAAQAAQPELAQPALAEPAVQETLPAAEAASTETGVPEPAQDEAESRKTEPESSPQLALPGLESTERKPG